MEVRVARRRDEAAHVTGVNHGRDVRERMRGIRRTWHGMPMVPVLALTPSARSSRIATATAERAVAPRVGASSDSETVAGTVPRSATQEVAAEAAGRCSRNSCRFMATRCR